MVSNILSIRRQCCALQERHVLDKLPSAWVVVLLAVSSMAMNYQCLLNKVSLNRHTEKTRLSIDGLVKMLWPEMQEPNPVILLGAVAQYLLIQCSQQLCRTKPTQIMRLYLRSHCTVSTHHLSRVKGKWGLTFLLSRLETSFHRTSWEFVICFTKSGLWWNIIWPQDPAPCKT